MFLAAADCVCVCLCDEGQDLTAKCWNFEDLKIMIMDGINFGLSVLHLTCGNNLECWWLKLNNFVTDVTVSMLKFCKETLKGKKLSRICLTNSKAKINK